MIGAVPSCRHGPTADQGSVWPIRKTCIEGERERAEQRRDMVGQHWRHLACRFGGGHSCPDFSVLQEVAEPRDIGRNAGDDGLLQGELECRERSVAVTAVSNDLGDQQMVNSGLYRRSSSRIDPISGHGHETASLAGGGKEAIHGSSA